MKGSTGLYSLLLGTLLLCSELVFAEQKLSDAERMLPVFDLPSVQDVRWNAESLQGKVWVINFWATWCPPCIEEMPSMNAAWEALEGQGVGMLAINAGEALSAIEVFLTKVSIDFPVLLGDVDTLSHWSIRALPTTIIVNREGEVVYEALGPREWDDEALLAKILALNE